MVYLKARDIFEDKPDNNLNADIILSLHSFGLREVSGVGIDNNYNLLYDKKNPSFFQEFQAGAAKLS